MTPPSPEPPNPEAQLPLTPAIYHILLALTDGERHGYSIMREVETYTAGQLRLGPTTLYRSIKQLLASGMIFETEERPDPTLDDERRRYYRLAPFGRSVLVAETRRIARLLAVAHTKGLIAESDLPGIALGGAS